MWQGGLRHARPDVVRHGGIVQGHAQQATIQIAASQPAQNAIPDRPARRSQLQEGQIMYIVNNILKGTASNMDSNRVEFYKYCIATPSATATDAFQQAYSHFVNVLAQGA
jgi:hypothetical protein